MPFIAFPADPRAPTSLVSARTTVTKAGPVTLLDSWRELHRIAARQTPAMAGKMYALFRRMGDVIPLDALEHAVKTGLVSHLMIEAPTRLLREDAPVDAITKAILSGGQTEAHAFNLHFGVKLAFGDTNPYAQARADEQSATMISYIDASTEQTIRETIGRAFSEQLPPRETAELIQPMIGLLPQHAQAVLNYESGLVESGVSAAAAADAADRYADTLLRYRATMIARHEILSAANGGQSDLWDTAVDAGYLAASVKRKWIITPDDRLCDLCASMTGARAIVRLHEPWDTPNGPCDIPQEIHPQCRCAQALVV